MRKSRAPVFGDRFVSPFFREIFKAMPDNARLRDLLNDFFLAMFIEADSIPPDLKALGAGSNYHIAVLSPHALTPMVIIEVERRPDEVVGGRRAHMSSNAPGCSRRSVNELEKLLAGWGIQLLLIDGAVAVGIGCLEFIGDDRFILFGV